MEYDANYPDTTGEIPRTISETWFRTTLYSIGDAVITIDARGKVLQMNHIAEQITGWSESEAAGADFNSIFRVVNEETREPVENPFIKVMHRGSAAELANHTLMISKSGSEIPIADSGAPIRDEDGDIIGVVIVFRDQSRERNAEKALRESEEKYRSLFEDSKDTIYITSPDGAILDINPAGIETFGYSSKEEMQAASIREELYWNPGDRDAYIEAVQRNGYVKDYEIALKRKDGSKMIVLDTSTVVYDEDGAPAAYRGILRDITKQRILEERFLHMQKMESIGTLAGGIAHDFNNILGIIIGHASLIGINSGDPEKLNRGIEVIQQATRRGTSLVQQLLTFARKSDVKYQSVRINDIIHEIAQLLHETMPKQIEVRLDLRKNLPSIVADVTQIHQVLLNLALNARDAMPDGGTMTICSTLIPREDIPVAAPNDDAREFILIRVSDTGIGMDAKTRQRIFDPFFTTKEPGKGTGLGLALVYSITESYNGMVDVQSQPGKGSTFSIFLPVQHTAPILEGMTDDALHDEVWGSEKVLLIEDEEMLIDSLRSMLIEHGYSVVTANDGEEGIQMYTLHSSDLFDKGIDIVISDIGLPKLGGDQVYKKLKEIDPNVKIILASGYIDPETRSSLKKMGASHIVQKPYLPSKVLRMIRTILDEK
jgi:two-component system, cell cycle sensor histidine kinase and response regulator CckA